MSLSIQQSVSLKLEKRKIEHENKVQIFDGKIRYTQKCYAA